MTRLETLCYAIMQAEGWAPGSRSWRDNNPGNLKASVFKHGADGEFCTFHTFADGWLALFYDVASKCVGHTRTGLSPESTLLDFLKVWVNGNDEMPPEGYTAKVYEITGENSETKLAVFGSDI